MKKLMTLAALFVMALYANAQLTITPQVGATLASITDDDDAKYKVGLVAGANVAYPLTDAFSLSAGLLYTMQGLHSDYLDKNMNSDYLNIPILAQYRIVGGLSVKAGVQPGFLLSAKLDGHSVKDSYEKFDIAIPLGLAYEISDFVIDARYNWGMKKIGKGGYSDAKNSVFMLTLGYKIPL